MRLEGKVALITGASRGIGRAIAEGLALQGATVVGTATSKEGTEGISAFLAEREWPGMGIILDVSDPTSIDSALAVISDQLGVPAILVNNAGITRDNLLMRMKDEEWETILNINLTAIYRLSKGCLRGMMKTRWGRIINITSVTGVMGNAGQTNYAAAKAGMIGFTKALAREVGTRGVTVNAVAPGFIDTDMTRDLADTRREMLLAQIPLNRLGKAQEVAAAVAFLASLEASYITGETLHVNGGLYMA
ncbi:3-oxoacyl-[acyl-carrier-protein] reductase [Nitrosococcus oceani ATCC 19707]|uniref:3-oxoacyl-[acyl-carrier-protein] reductase n=2 Tax=Nitrosococcus oceani TaxID=1229 RepID=Q3JAK9_NITOC|nr:3-oxoacyl-ACP reductase FabG [Nitrosococcus oceani]ABA58137.1 3-oxoacyl-[acyl-carrier-protein] reductase [Nitrosococcus oceani ATCC 19707]EDZ68509.1 3-oxoacyl-(acyl-carrier-protein) reductase [Nitrosococcus oceani AFC27]KFI19468.1 3-ketoacyl-ACP reductase [Nitrosococcus oceani C-27]GEM21311.1 beta-ketoacyl-ACP reductase [Nitrosococcus oceani]